MTTLPRTTEKPSNYVPSSSLFAQLLAEEQIRVSVDPSQKTASFNPTTRELILPNYKDFESDAWYLFIAHEVGHAKFTPADWIKNPKVAAIRKRHRVSMGQVHSVLNVLEDIRIERKIRDLYRGLSGVFSRGYAELIKRNFFGFGETMTAQRWAKYGILDHLNLYGKVGALCGLSLTDANQIAWYNRAVKAETFEDVLDLASDLIDHVKEQKAEATQKHDAPSAPEDSDEDFKEDEDEDSDEKNDAAGEGADGDSSNDEDSPSEDKNSAEGESDSGGGEDIEADIPESDEGQSGASDESDESDEDGDESDESDEDGDESDESDSEGDSSNDEDTDNESDSDTGDASSSDVESEKDTNTTPQDIKDLQSETQEAADKLLEDSAVDHDRYAGGNVPLTILPSDLKFLNLDDIDLQKLLGEWGATPSTRTAFMEAETTLRREAGTVLASMVANFRANQSAEIARRVQIAKSGMIDPTRLSQYRTSEDIFRKRVFLNKGQNHGFVLNIDWSGSMARQLGTVLWQVLHLVWFAETINVPIEVYAFTTNSTPDYDETTAIRKSKGFHTGFWSGRTFSHNVCLYSSSAPATLKKEARAHLLMLSWKFDNVAAHLHHVTNIMLDHEIPSKITRATFKTMGMELTAQPASLGAAFDKLFSGLSGREINLAFVQNYATLGATPFYFALMSTANYVRKFREANRLEQCVSVWLTDGEDSQGISHSDPRLVDRYEIGAYNISTARIFSPLTGKTYDVEKDYGALSTNALLDYHKDATGAAVVVLDINRNPIESFCRVLDSSALNEVNPFINPVAATTPAASRPGRYRRYRSRRPARIPTKTEIKQAKQRLDAQNANSKTLRLRKKGSFVEDGVIMITKKEFPIMTADAYLVSDPTWWAATSRFQTARINGAAAAAGTAGRAAVRETLVKQSASSSMRKFAELLVPFLADSNNR